MRQYKGLTEGGNWVYGNLIVNNAQESDGIHKSEPLRTYIRERDYTRITDDSCWMYLIFEVIPETLRQQTGLKDKNGLTDIYEDDIIGVDGLIKGNQYENPNLLQDKTNLIVSAITSEDWQETYKQAMVRGCKHAK